MKVFIQCKESLSPCWVWSTPHLKVYLPRPVNFLPPCSCTKLCLSTEFFPSRRQEPKKSLQPGNSYTKLSEYTNGDTNRYVQDVIRPSAEWREGLLTYTLWNIWIFFKLWAYFTFITNIRQYYYQVGLPNNLIFFWIRHRVVIPVTGEDRRNPKSSSFFYIKELYLPS